MEKGKGFSTLDRSWNKAEYSMCGYFVIPYCIDHQSVGCAFTDSHGQSAVNKQCNRGDVSRIISKRRAFDSCPNTIKQRPWRNAANPSGLITKRHSREVKGSRGRGPKTVTIGSFDCNHQWRRLVPHAHLTHSAPNILVFIDESQSHGIPMERQSLMYVQSAIHQVRADREEIMYVLL